jgi:hypothetical protein
MNKTFAILSAFAVGLTAYSIITFISAFLVQLFWNNSVPDLFRVPEITYWQAWFLNMLCVVLFKSSGTFFNNKN